MIEMAGQISHGEISEIYNEVDVVVCASRCEGMSATALEGFSCGKPLITSDAAGGAGFITDGAEGLVFANGDVESLREKMMWMLDNREQASDMGKRGRAAGNIWRGRVPRDKLVTYRVLEIPRFRFDQYIKLKESRVSIVSNNCWGGLIYHTLGMECLSPFKNLYLEDADYLKLLGNLKYYLNCDLQFQEYAIEIHSGAKYPVMRLDDVSVHCNHAETAEY